MTVALQGLFGLAATEAAIAGTLADGRSTAAIAARQCLTPNTARVHMKNVLAKTRTTRQAQLVSLILRSVAGLASV